MNSAGIKKAKELVAQWDAARENMSEHSFENYKKSQGNLFIRQHIPGGTATGTASANGSNTGSGSGDTQTITNPSTRSATGRPSPVSSSSGGLTVAGNARSTGNTGSGAPEQQQETQTTSGSSGAAPTSSTGRTGKVKEWAQKWDQFVRRRMEEQSTGASADSAAEGDGLEQLDNTPAEYNPGSFDSEASSVFGGDYGSSELDTHTFQLPSGNVGSNLPQQDVGSDPVEAATDAYDAAVEAYLGEGADGQQLQGTYSFMGQSYATKEEADAAVAAYMDYSSYVTEYGSTAGTEYGKALKTYYEWLQQYDEANGSNEAELFLQDNGVDSIDTLVKQYEPVWGYAGQTYDSEEARNAAIANASGNSGTSLMYGSTSGAGQYTATIGGKTYSGTLAELQNIYNQYQDQVNATFPTVESYTADDGTFDGDGFMAATLEAYSNLKASDEDYYNQLLQDKGISSPEDIFAESLTFQGVKYNSFAEVDAAREAYLNIPEYGDEKYAGDNGKLAYCDDFAAAMERWKEIDQTAYDSYWAYKKTQTGCGSPEEYIDGIKGNYYSNLQSKLSTNPYSLSQAEALDLMTHLQAEASGWGGTEQGRLFQKLSTNNTYYDVWLFDSQNGSQDYDTMLNGKYDELLYDIASEFISDHPDDEDALAMQAQMGADGTISDELREKLAAALCLKGWDGTEQGQLFMKLHATDTYKNDIQNFGITYADYDRMVAGDYDDNVLIPMAVEAGLIQEGETLTEEMRTNMINALMINDTQGRSQNVVSYYNRLMATNQKVLNAYQKRQDAYNSLPEDADTSYHVDGVGDGEGWDLASTFHSDLANWKSLYPYLTQQDVDVMNAYYNSGDRWAAYNYFNDIISPFQLASESDNLKEEIDSIAQKGGWEGAAANVGLFALRTGTLLINEFTGPFQFLYKLIGDNTDYNTLSTAGAFTQQVQESQAEAVTQYAIAKFGEDSFWAKPNALTNGKSALAYVYDTLVSTWDSGVNLAVGGTFTGAADLAESTIGKSRFAQEVTALVVDALMSSGAAAESLRTGIQSGKDVWPAVRDASTSGFIEAATEIWSIQAYLHIGKSQTLKDVLKGVVGSFFSEATEEVAGAVADDVLNTLYGNEEGFWSEVAQKEIELKASEDYEYVSDEKLSHDAQWAVIGDWSLDALGQGLSGGLSGGLMGVKQAAKWAHNQYVTKPYLEGVNAFTAAPGAEGMTLEQASTSAAGQTNAYHVLQTAIQNGSPALQSRAQKLMDEYFTSEGGMTQEARKSVVYKIGAIYFDLQQELGTDKAQLKEMDAAVADVTVEDAKENYPDIDVEGLQAVMPQIKKAVFDARQATQEGRALSAGTANFIASITDPTIRQYVTELVYGTVEDQAQEQRGGGYTGEPVTSPAGDEGLRSGNDTAAPETTPEVEAEPVEVSVTPWQNGEQGDQAETSEVDDGTNVEVPVTPWQNGDQQPAGYKGDDVSRATDDEGLRTEGTTQAQGTQAQQEGQTGSREAVKHPAGDNALRTGEEAESTEEQEQAEPSREITDKDFLRGLTEYSDQFDVDHVTSAVISEDGLYVYVTMDNGRHHTFKLNERGKYYASTLKQQAEAARKNAEQKRRQRMEADAAAQKAAREAAEKEAADPGTTEDGEHVTPLAEEEAEDDGTDVYVPVENWQAGQDQGQPASGYKGDAVTREADDQGLKQPAEQNDQAAPAEEAPAEEAPADEAAKDEAPAEEAEKAQNPEKPEINKAPKKRKTAVDIANEAEAKANAKLLQLYDLIHIAGNQATVNAVKARAKAGVEAYRKAFAQLQEEAAKAAAQERASHVNGTQATTTNTADYSNDSSVTFDGQDGYKVQSVSLDYVDGTEDKGLHYYQTNVVISNGTEGGTYTVTADDARLKWNGAGRYVLAKAAAASGHRYSATALSALWSGYRGGDVASYMNDFNAVYNAAYDGNAAPQSTTMTADQVAQVQTIAKQEAQQEEQKRLDKQKKGHKAHGKVDTSALENYKDENGNTVQIKLNENQQAAIDVLKQIADVTGVDINVIARRGGSQGSYKDNVITVNILSGNLGVSDSGELMMKKDGVWLRASKTILLDVTAHELTHFMEANSKDEYIRLVNAVRRKMGIEQFNALVEAHQQDYSQDGARLTRQGAISETVADACSKMLLDTKAIEQLKSEDRSLYERIRDWVKNWISNIRKAMSTSTRLNESIGDPRKTGLDYMRAEKARNGLQFYDVEFAKAWDITLIEAAHNVYADEANPSVEAHNTVLDQVSQESLAAYETDKAEYQRMLLEHGMTESQVIDLFSTVDAVADMVRANRNSLDFEDMWWDRNITPIKDNSDAQYVISLDFSTLCRKRLLQQAVVEELTRREGRAPSSEEQIAIRNQLIALRERGLAIEVACGLCFVESARLKGPTQINRFFDDRRAVAISFFAKHNKEYMQKVNKAQAEWLLKHSHEADMALKELSTSEKNAITKMKQEMYAKYTPTAAEERAIKKLEALPAEVFLSGASLDALRIDNPISADIFNEYLRNATKSKGLSGDVSWRAGEYSKRISDEVQEKLNSLNGTRSQTWSDFQVKHMLDYMCMIMELSTKNAMIQTYTKVPAFVRLMGKTGAMINCSMIPTETLHGELAFDSNEGMSWADMYQLRHDYPNTVGNISIGISNAQILNLLASDDIDMVIPYHASSLSKGNQRKMGLMEWVNYTKSQNETLKSNGHSAGNKGIDFSEWYSYEKAKQYQARHLKEGMSMRQASNAAMDDCFQDYLKLCEERELNPKFADFKDVKGAWKLLVDHKMINQETGDIIQQQAVQPNFDKETLLDILQSEVDGFDAKQLDKATAIGAVLDNWSNIKKAAKIKEQAKQLQTLAESRDAAVLRETYEQAGREVMERQETLGDVLTREQAENGTVQYSFAYTYDGEGKYTQAAWYARQLMEYMHLGEQEVIDKVRDEMGVEVRRGYQENDWVGVIPNDHAHLDLAVVQNYLKHSDSWQLKHKLKLSDVYKHDEVYQEYPGIADYYVQFSDTLGKGVLGQFDPTFKRISLSSDYAKAINDPAMAVAMEQTLRHEVQHAIQDHCHMESGTNDSFWKYILSNMRTAVRQMDSSAHAMERVFGYNDETYTDFYANGEGDVYLNDTFGQSADIYRNVVQMRDSTMHFLNEYGSSKQSAFYLYLNNPGEIEARAASERDNGSLHYDPDMSITNQQATDALHSLDASYLSAYQAAEQAKEAAQNKGTQFSLASTIEEGRNLLVVHDVQSYKLLNMLQGTQFPTGLPAISIGIVDIRRAYTGFGDVSLVFDKRTARPGYTFYTDKNGKSYSRQNWVMGGDGYTNSNVQTYKGDDGKNYIAERRWLDPRTHEWHQTEANDENLADHIMHFSGAPDGTRYTAGGLDLGAAFSQMFDSLDAVKQAGSVRLHHGEGYLGAIDNSPAAAAVIDDLKTRIYKDVLGQTQTDYGGTSEGYRERRDALVRAIAHTFDQGVAAWDDEENNNDDDEWAMETLAQHLNEQGFDYTYEYGVQNKTLRSIVDWMHKFQRTYKRGYFEAKPDGVVRWEEVKYAVIPQTAMTDLAPLLQNKGIQVVPYTDTEDRKAKLQELDDRYQADYPEEQEGLQFSLRSDASASDVQQYSDTQYSLRVTDQDTLDMLNNQKHITTYRAMQLIDGKLYPPMAEVIGGKKNGSREDASQIGSWEMAAEHPELIKFDKSGKPKFTLTKIMEDGTVNTVDAAYNPYMHSSNTVLNDQFSSAYIRPNLVVVQCEVPVSESDGAYQAQYAKDATGWHEWKAGIVAGDLAKQKPGFRRDVFLSRYLKPVRILSTDEVAEKIAGYMEGTSVTIPYQCVWPALRDSLTKQGIKISEPRGMGKPQTEKAMESYNEWKNSQGNNTQQPVTDKAGQLDFSDYGVQFSLEVKPDGQIDLSKYPSTSMNFHNVSSYDTHQLHNIYDYLNGVDAGLAAYYNSFLQGGRNAETSAYLMGKLPQKAVDQIKNILGVDTTDYTLQLNVNAANHIMSRHGPNGEADHTMRDPNDVARMKYALSHFTFAQRGPSTTAYRQYNKQIGANVPSPTIVYYAPIDGTIVVVQAVPNTKMHRTGIVSAYVQNKKATNLAGANSPLLTANTGSQPASADSIAQNAITGNVQSGIPQNSLRPSDTLTESVYTSNDLLARIDTGWLNGTREVNTWNMYKKAYDEYAGLLKSYRSEQENVKNATTDEEKEAAKARAEIYYRQLLDAWDKVDKIANRKAMRDISDRVNSIVDRYVMGHSADQVAKDITELEDKVRELRADIGKKLNRLQHGSEKAAVTEALTLFDTDTMNKVAEEILTNSNSKMGVETLKKALAPIYMQLTQEGVSAADVMDQVQRLADRMVKESDYRDYKTGNWQYGSESENQYKLDHSTAMAYIVGMFTAYHDDLVNAKASTELVSSLQKELKRQLTNEGLAEKIMTDADAALGSIYSKLGSIWANNVQAVADMQLAVTVLKSQAAKDLMGEKQKAEETMRKNKALREAAIEIDKARRAVERIVSDLNTRYSSPADYKNVPEEYRQLVNAFLSAIATHDASGHKIAFERKKAEALLTAYNGMKAEDERFDGMVFDDEMRDAIADLTSAMADATALAGTRNVDDVQQKLVAWQRIREVAEYVNGVVRHGADVFLDGKRTEAIKAAMQFLQDNGGKGNKTITVGGGKVGQTVDMLKNAITWGNLTPEYFFRMMGDRTMTGLNNTIRQGENTYGLLMAEAYKAMEEIGQRFNRQTWDDKQKVTLNLHSGISVTMSAQQAMSLYATWKREHTPGQIASRHLEYGGFVLALDQYEGKRRKEQTRSVSGYSMSESDFEQLSGLLSDDQKGFTDAIVDYLSHDMSELGNEASMKLYGIRKYKQNYYFPIKSSKDTMYQKSDAAAQSTTDDSRMKHQGWTKSRLANANNAILLEGFEAVALGHVQQMITYASFVEGLESMNRVLNTHVDEKSTVRSLFQEKFGEDAKKYLMRYIADLNGGVSRGDTHTGIDTLLGIFRKSAVAGSLSVAFQQPLSFIRAAYAIDPKYLAGSYTKGVLKGKTYDEMMKWSGLANIKSIGRFDASLGRSAMEWISGAWQKKTALTVADHILNGLPEYMDAITWCQLWRAVKAEQAHLNPGMNTASDEFMEKVADRFNGVIRTTQVYDSVLVRSQMMRNKDTMSKSLTSFMAEPTLTINMLYDSARNGNEKGAQRAGKLARATGAFLISAILQAAVKALMGTGRKDDDNDTWIEQFWYKFMGQVVSEANPLNSIPGYSNIVDALTGNDVAMDAYSSIQDLWDAMLGIGNAINSFAKGEITAESVYTFIENGAGTLTQIFTSYPIKNAMRDLRAVTNLGLNMVGVQSPLGGNNVSRATNAGVMKYLGQEGLINNDFFNIINYVADGMGMDEPFQVNNTSYYEKLYDAMQAGDDQAKTELKDFLLLSKLAGKEDPEGSLQTGLKKAATAACAAGEISPEDAASWIMANCPAEDDTLTSVYNALQKKLGGGKIYTQVYEAINSGDTAALKELLDFTGIYDLNGDSKAASTMRTNVRKECVTAYTSGKMSLDEAVEWVMKNVPYAGKSNTASYTRKQLIAAWNKAHPDNQITE